METAKASDRIEEPSSSDDGPASGTKEEANVSPLRPVGSLRAVGYAPEGITDHASQISGYESLGRVVLVDQSALGKSPRSNPAVYIGAFDDIREVFAQSEEAKHEA